MSAPSLSGRDLALGGAGMVSSFGKKGQSWVLTGDQQPLGLVPASRAITCPQ